MPGMDDAWSALARKRERAADQMEVCRYCNRRTGAPCRNTRDMTEAAITGDDECLGQVAKLDGGEAGLKYICLNRARVSREQ